MGAGDRRVTEKRAPARITIANISPSRETHGFPAFLFTELSFVNGDFFGVIILHGLKAVCPANSYHPAENSSFSGTSRPWFNVD